MVAIPREAARAGGIPVWAVQLKQLELRIQSMAGN